MVRFIQQFDPGMGDYTKERKALLASVTMEDVERQLAEMAETRKKADPARKDAAARKPLGRQKAAKRPTHA